MITPQFVTISRKFIIMISFLLFVMVPITEFYSFLKLSRVISDTIETKGKSFSLSVASTCPNAIIGHDTAFLQHALNQTKLNDPDVVFCMIMKSDSTVLVSTDELQNDMVLDDKVSQEVVINQSGVVQYWDNNRMMRVKEFYEPIVINNKFFGVIRIGFSMNSLGQARMEAITTTIVKSVLFILIFNGVAYLAARRITIPIKQLVQDVVVLSSGNLDKQIKVDTNDEVGLLAHAFEKMRNSLKIHIREVARRALALEGELEMFAFPDLIQLVCSSKRTGLLKIQFDSTTGAIFFDHGEITDAHLNDSLQGQEAFFGMLGITSGSFSFFPGEKATQITISMNWQQLIIEGACHNDELARFRDVIPSFKTIITLTDPTSENVKSIKLSREEFDVISLIRGQKQVAEILKESEHGTLKTLHILHDLVFYGLAKTSADMLTIN